MSDVQAMERRVAGCCREASNGKTYIGGYCKYCQCWQLQAIYPTARLIFFRSILFTHICAAAAVYCSLITKQPPPGPPPDAGGCRAGAISCWDLTLILSYICLVGCVVSGMVVRRKRMQQQSMESSLGLEGVWACVCFGGGVTAASLVQYIHSDGICLVGCVVSGTVIRSECMQQPHIASPHCHLGV